MSDLVLLFCVFWNEFLFGSVLIQRHKTCELLEQTVKLLAVNKIIIMCWSLTTINVSPFGYFFIKRSSNSIRITDGNPTQKQIFRTIEWIDEYQSSLINWNKITTSTTKQRRKKRARSNQTDRVLSFRSRHHSSSERRFRPPKKK